MLNDDGCPGGGGVRLFGICGKITYDGIADDVWGC